MPCDEFVSGCSVADPSCTITEAELMEVVDFLAADAQEGRDNDTPGSSRVQAFLIDRLQTFASGGAADGTFRQALPDGSGTNILARLPGRDPTAREAVIVGAHYDHFGTHSGPDGRCSPGFPAGGAVCNGATDNAAGVAAVLAVGRAIARLSVPPLRPVFLALWDREEDGLLGSSAYVQTPVVALPDTVAYVNLDIAGSNPVQGLRRSTFLVGVDTGDTLPALVHSITDGDPLTVESFSVIFGEDRSDHAVFYRQNVPVLFFSDATGGCYHTIFDDIDTVHFGKLAREAWLGFKAVLALANGSDRPTFTPPNALPVLSDVAVLRDALQRGLCGAIVSGLTDAQIATVRNWIDQLTGMLDAPSTFNSLRVLRIAIDAEGILVSLPCQAN